MARLTASERLAKEKKKFAAQKARLQALEARVKKQQDKDLTRAKILLGWWVIETWKGLPAAEHKERLNTALSAMTRDKDKEVLAKVISEELGVELSK